MSTFFLPPQPPAPFIHAPFNTRICSAVRKFIRRSRGANIWQLLRPRAVHPFWGNKAWTPAPHCGAQPLVCVVPFRSSISWVLMPWCGQSHSAWFITVLTLSPLLILTLLWPYNPPPPNFLNLPPAVSHRSLYHIQLTQLCVTYIRSVVALMDVWSCLVVLTIGLLPCVAFRVVGLVQREPIRVSLEVASFWLCGRSKRPQQSHPTNASHNLPCLFSSVVPSNVISRTWTERKMDERRIGWRGVEI